MSAMSVMSAEIQEQSDAIAATLHSLQPSRSELCEFFDDARSVLFMARGTSDNVADPNRPSTTRLAHTLNTSDIVAERTREGGVGV